MIDNSHIRRRLEQLGHPRVLILGDLILDRYVSGEVRRISPEAPIPVLTAHTSEFMLGGAGNVAANLRTMEAEVSVVGVVGDDVLATEMCARLEDLGARMGLVTDATRPTTEKTRMMSGVQQMLRVDWEEARTVGSKVEAALSARVLEGLGDADALVISDYGKGVLSPGVLTGAIEAARGRGIPVLVDPKGVSYDRYRGATLITPNRREAERAVGRPLDTNAEIQAAGADLIRLAQLEQVVITLGPRGIYFQTAGEGDERVEGRVPAVARAVYDVTGAGDTVVAQLALCLADEWSLEEAVTLANQAAGIVVGRLGASSVTRAELREGLSGPAVDEGKVCDEQSLGGLLQAWRQEGKRVVFTNGCFDVLHAGHVEYLRFARSQGDTLIVGVNSDASVARLKGPSRPVNPLGDRLKVLAALESVSAVAPFGEDDPERLIREVTPDVLVKGEDWKDKGVVGREWVESHGGRVVLAPLLAGRSTSSILERARGEAPTPPGGGA